MYRNDAINVANDHENQSIENRLTKPSNLPKLSDETDLTLVQQKQTTHQITTVTKVVREVKRFQPDGYLVNYAAMPYDAKANLAKSNTVEFSPINTAMGSQLLYNELNATHHQLTDSKDCITSKDEAQAQYTALQSYDQYPSSYPSSIYVTKSPTMAVPGVGPQCSFRKNHNPCTTIGSPPNQITVSTEEINAEHNLMPTLKFVQTTQYDEMPDYGMTAGPQCQVDANYSQEAAIAYGYVPEPNYGLTGNILNINTIQMRQPILYDNNLNGSTDITSLIPPPPPAGLTTRPFELQPDFQNKMSQLTINPIEMPACFADNKDGLLDESTADLCTMRWRDPNLSEVISFLNNPNNKIKANAAAYLQHLCYMDDPNKQRTRMLGGIPPLIRLLSYDIPEIHRNACGALRNLSYGRQNDENKRAIRNAGGITALVNLLSRTQDSDVKELVTGVLWNLSSCEDIKRSIIDESLQTVVSNIVKPHSGWDAVCPGETCYSTVFRNASGVLRNVSSAGEFARTSLREAEHLVECLLYVVRTAIEKNNIGNKTVENCVCVLRNLSYRCQEVEDSNYDKQPMVIQNRTTASSSKGENLGCFGTSKKKKDTSQNVEHVNETAIGTSAPKHNSNKSFKRYEQLWQPEVVQYYLALLQSCSNPETLEAAAGAIQNLSACFWQPSIDIRATVRKEKGLPILVELLRMEVDRVVCAVATALRNLAIDQRNKELIGKYAMRDLVQKLPSGNPQHDQNTSDDTISAVLATINEVIKKNPEFSRSLLDAGGVERLMNISKQRLKYTSCVLKFASQVLFTMWQHHELRDVYKKNGWKEQDFVTKYFPAPNSPNNANNTLNRPMASQSRTKYEDRTIQRQPNNSNRANGTAGGGGGSGVSGSGAAGIVQQQQQQQQPQQQHVIYNDSSMLCQMVDDGSVNALSEDIYQRSAHNSMMAMYIPIVDSGRNHSN